MSLYSQETLNSTSLTDKDTVPVTVNYRYIVATRMLYKDYLGLKKVEAQQLFTINSQEKQISSLLKQTEKYSQNDSIANIRFKNDSILINNFENKFKANRRAKIAASISVPVAAILSFLLGWHLSR
jgi:hypothetical protein